MEFAERIQSTRGKEKLVYRDYVFIADQMRNNRYYWRCKAVGCKGRLVTQIFDSKHHVLKTSVHNHYPPGPNSILVRRKISKKKLAFQDKSAFTKDEFADHIILSRSGKEKLVFRGCIFIGDQVRKGRYYWRCSEFGCKGRIVTQKVCSKHRIQKRSAHNHSSPDIKNSQEIIEVPEVKFAPALHEDLGITFESEFCIEETTQQEESYTSAYIIPETISCNIDPKTVYSDYYSSHSSQVPSLLSLTGFTPPSLLPSEYYQPNMSPARGIHTAAGRTPFGVHYEPPLEILKPLSVPTKLLLGAGPANTPRKICDASAMPMLGHLHPEFLKIMDETKAGIQYAFQTKNQYTFAISGTGHCAMEASLCNLLERGDRVLIVCCGIWGERASNMAERCGAVVTQLKVPLGEPVTVENVEQELHAQSQTVTAVFVCHGESSTGILQPLEGLGDVCHRHNCLLIVDTVASLGGAPVHMDALGIDVLYSGSQKVLNAPPGISPISFSARAIDHIRNRKTKVQSYYMDALLLGNYWNCDDKPIGYHHTGMVTLVYALREGLSGLAEEGLHESWRRHKSNAELLYARLEELGLKLFVKDQKHRLPTVTSVLVPEGVDGKLVSEYCMKKFALEVAGGLGPTAGKVWRIGLMGCNSTPRNIDFVVRALDEAIRSCSMQNKL